MIYPISNLTNRRPRWRAAFRQLSAVCVSLLAAAVLASITIVACGPYSFSSSGNANIRTVAIPIFQDQTAEFGIKEKLTDEIVTQFTRDNTLRISDRRSADSLLEGTIIRVEDRAGTFTSAEQVKDIQIFITARVRYQDLKKRKVIWEDDITQWGTFNPDEGPEQREAGIDEAVAKIASEVLNKSVSGW